jgi:hypothetical protein
MRRLKLGVLLGFGIGYVLGAKAGRERYVQIQRSWEQLKTSPVVEKAVETAKNMSSRGPLDSLGRSGGNGRGVGAGAKGFGAP